MAYTTPTLEELLAYPAIEALGLTDAQIVTAVALSEAYVEEVTGRNLPDLDGNLAVIATEAVKMRTAQVGYGQSAKATAVQLNDDGIQSFSVPGYSETKFDRAAAMKDVKGAIVNPWRALWDLLWLLMLPEKREEWVAAQNGEHAPAWSVTEVDWSASDLGWGDLMPVRELGS